LTLSIGIPVDDTKPVVGSSDSDSNSWRRPTMVDAAVDYVRIYQPIKSLPLAEEDIWKCAAVRNDVMLNLLEGMYVCGKGPIDD